MLYNLNTLYHSTLEAFGKKISTACLYQGFQFRYHATRGNSSYSLWTHTSVLQNSMSFFILKSNKFTLCIFAYYAYCGSSPAVIGGRLKRIIFNSRTTRVFTRFRLPSHKHLQERPVFSQDFDYHLINICKATRVFTRFRLPSHKHLQERPVFLQDFDYHLINICKSDPCFHKISITIS